MADRLTADDVRYVATLARLRLTDEETEAYRSQLASILHHLETLSRLDVAGVEPLAHPLDVTNRLAEDEVAAPLPLADVLRNAPAAEGPFLAVPKVLEDAGGG